MTNHAADLHATYERQATTFHAERSRSLFEGDWLDRFLTLLPSGCTVLDLGCGSGTPLGREMLKRGVQVTGVDFSEAMLSIARAELPEGNWQLGDMRSLNLGRRYDGVLAFNSLFHLSPNEQRSALPRILDHVRTAFLTTTGHGEGEVFGTVGGERVYQGSLDMEEYANILAANGFAVQDHRTDPSCNDHTLLLATREETKIP